MNIPDVPLEYFDQEILNDLKTVWHTYTDTHLGCEIKFGDEKYALHTTASTNDPDIPWKTEPTETFEEKVAKYQFIEITHQKIEQYPDFIVSRVIARHTVKNIKPPMTIEL